MRNVTLALVLTAALGCKGEQPVDTDLSDADTDTDADSDADADADTDAEEITVDEDGEVISDDLDDAGERDLYSFDAVEGSYYWIFAVSASGGEGEPDTVVRVLDSTGAMIGENDDLPYRISGTDGGYFYRASETGTNYIQVLEWSDWAGEDPVGGSGWDYDLIVADATLWFPEGNEDGEGDNDDIAEASENLATLYDDTDTENNRYDYYIDPYSSALGSQGGYYWNVGAILEAGDVDVSAVRFTDDEVPGTFEFSFFPGIASEIDPLIELYTEDGTLVASTDDPEFYPVSVGTGYDVGISFPVLEAGDYFLMVSDASGGSGADHWYTLIGSVASYIDEVAVHDLTTAETDPTANYVDVTLLESDATAGFFYGFPVGRLAEDTDDWDSFRLSGEAIEAGKLMTVSVATQAIGSELDAQIRVLDANGDELTAAASSAGFPDDPGFEQFELPSNVAAPLFLVVERDNDSTAMGASAYYEGIVYFED